MKATFPNDGARRLLVWDACRVHLTEKVKQLLNRRNVDIAVIPGGMTSILQPLDVSINQPMKVNLRSLWTDWLVSGKQEFQPSGKRKPASRETVVGWVADAWHQITPAMVQQSFLKCGIANALDGAQDDALYEDLVARRPDPDSSDTDSDSEVVVPPSLFEESDTETEFEGFQKGVDY